jgi:DinB superfamily
MNSYMPKAQLLSMIQSARTDWELLLAGIPEAWMSEPGVVGEWSVKDVVAHIAWGEQESLGVAEAHAVVGSELWQLSQDERNAAVFEQNRRRELQEVLADAQQIFHRYFEAVAALSDEDLNDPSRFAGMPEGWRPCPGCTCRVSSGQYQADEGTRAGIARVIEDLATAPPGPSSSVSPLWHLSDQRYEDAPLLIRQGHCCPLLEGQLTTYLWDGLYAPW